MDDWDAFDPDLHAALNASLTPPNTGEQMQPTGSSHPTGSEATVQSAHQVHGQAQAATTRPHSVQQGTFSWTNAPMFLHVQQAHEPVE